MSEHASNAIDAVSGIEGALQGLKARDAASALSNLATAVRDIGGKDGNSGRAADGLDQLGSAVGKYTSSYTELKAGLSGITTELSALVAGWPAAAAALEGLGAAASAALIPLAAALGTNAIAQQLTHGAQINPWGNPGFSAPGGLLKSYDTSGAAGVNPDTRFGPNTNTGLPPAIAIPGLPAPPVMSFSDSPFGAIDPSRVMAGGAAASGTGAVASAGAYNGPDANGAFPSWVNDLGSRFNLTPSTYSGHQTTNRAEAGFAPNPQNFNRGIDWGGPGVPPERMQQFADFAQAHPDLFEQVIWNNPKTGQTVTIAGGRLVSPSYYADDLGGHTDPRPHPFL